MLHVCHPFWMTWWLLLLGTGHVTHRYINYKPNQQEREQTRSHAPESNQTNQETCPRIRSVNWRQNISGQIWPEWFIGRRNDEPLNHMESDENLQKLSSLAKHCFSGTGSLHLDRHGLRKTISCVQFYIIDFWINRTFPRHNRSHATRNFGATGEWS